MQAPTIIFFSTELSSTNELINYDAGHQGYAYAVGHFVGEAFQVIGTVAGVTALFLMPKS